MRTRARSAGLVGALTAAALLAGSASFAATGPSDRTQIDASADYPGHGAATTVTTHNGRIELVLTKAELSKYDVDKKSVVRRGKGGIAGADAGSADLLVHLDSRVAYVVEEGVRQAVVLVYDITGQTPRLTRTVGLKSLIPDGKQRYFYDAALTPDGRRLLLLGQDFVQILGLNNPAKPTGGKQFKTAHHGSNLAVTSDSRQLLVGYNAGEEPRLARYDLPRNGPGSLDTTAPVIVPGWEARGGRTGIGNLIASSGGASALVELTSSPDESGDSGLVSTAIARVNISSLHVAATTVPDDAGEQLFLSQVSNDGGRVYLTSGTTTDEPELPPRTALWTDAKTLASRHALSGLGDVRSMSVSPGGPTRGLLFVAAVRNDRHLLLQVDPH